MDTFAFVTSISKIAIVAFAITSGFIIYEVYLLIQQRKREKRPVIPKFKSTKHYAKMSTGRITVAKKKNEVYKRPNKRLILILLTLLLVFGLVFLFGSSFKDKLNVTKPRPQRVTQVEKIESSSGIAVFDKKWTKISSNTLGDLPGGELIYVSIATIPDVSIDKARIRVNSDAWSPANETSKFNKQLNVFYIEYSIPTDESKLNMEAQLHDAEEGWLGE